MSPRAPDRSNLTGMACRHGLEHQCRLKANAHGHEQPATPWVCDACHPPAAALVEHGLIEWADGRPTNPITPLPPNTDEVILRCVGGKTKKKVCEIGRSFDPPPALEPEPVDVVDEADVAARGKLVVPAPSEAKGPASKEQAAPGPVGSDPGTSEPARAAAPAPKPQFVDAAMVDLDAAVA